jgi:hypothetical protein
VIATIVMTAALLIVNLHCGISAKNQYKTRPSIRLLGFAALHYVFVTLLAPMLALQIAVWLSTP